MKSVVSVEEKELCQYLDDGAQMTYYFTKQINVLMLSMNDDLGQESNIQIFDYQLSVTIAAICRWLLCIAADT